MKHTMVDLETLGIRPGCVILSIGAVRFGPGATTKDQFYVNIVIADSVKEGLVIEPNTVEWWLKQSTDAQDTLFNPVPVSLRTALDKFRLFFQYGVGANTPPKEITIWSHGATFDIPVLAEAYIRIGQRVPWDYRNARDTRTIFSLVPDSVTDLKPTGITHHALHDAINQARKVKAAMVWLNKNGKENES